MEALYRTYRPASFADVTGQEHVKTTLRNQLATGRLAHAYLFTGPRGVGKTTIARILAKAANCLNLKDGEPCHACASCLEIANGSALDISEIDAASQTDVDNVRENIIRSVRFAPAKLKYKVYVIDEVHMLSTASFNALLKTLEEPPAHGLFILATTEIHKVPATIISRCQRFDFRRIPADQMVARLQSIAEKEGVEVDENVLRDIARSSEGCERDAESLLGQVFALGEKKITSELASLVLPSTSSVLVADFLELLLKRDVPGAIRLVNAFLEQGVDLPHFADEAVEALRGLLFFRLGGEAAAPDFDKKLAERLAPVAASTSDLARVIRVLLETRRGMKTDKIPQLGLELAIVELGMGVEEMKKDQKDQEPKKIQPLPKIQEPKTEQAKPSAPPVEPPPVAVAAEVPASVTVPAASVVFNSIPVVSLDEIKRKWPDVFAHLKDVNASLPLVVQAGEITGADGDLLEFSFQYELHAKMVNQDKNRRLLEGAFEKVLGRRTRVRASYVKAESDAAVTDILQAFGGSAA